MFWKYTEAILDRSTRAPVESDIVDLIHVIGLYATYEYNLDIPLLAIDCLTLICSVAADWKPKAPSLVGYFGSVNI